MTSLFCPSTSSRASGGLCFVHAAQNASSISIRMTRPPGYATAWLSFAATASEIFTATIFDTPGSSIVTP